MDGLTDLRVTNADSKEDGWGFPFLERHEYRAVVFDWDGVLVDSGANYYRAYEMVLRDIGVATSPREIYLREGQPTPQVLTVILKQHGIAVSDAKIRELVVRRREYDIALGERKFFPGIWALVQRLRKAEYHVAIVTGSSRKSVERVLTPELENSFDVVITADDVAHPKPDPQPFVLAAKALALEPAMCLVIENAPFGIRSARAAGCGVVGMCTTLAAEDLNRADWIVPDHDRLKALLAATDQRTESEIQGRPW
jgi:HAD superfamily hydrolase (TIGR01509 family)